MCSGSDRIKDMSDKDSVIWMCSKICVLSIIHLDVIRGKHYLSSESFAKYVSYMNILPFLSFVKYDFQTIKLFFKGCIRLKRSIHIFLNQNSRLHIFVNQFFFSSEEELPSPREMHSADANAKLLRREYKSS